MNLCTDSLITKWVENELINSKVDLIKKSEKVMFDFASSVEGRLHRLRLGRAAFYLNDFYHFTLQEIGDIFGVSFEQARRYQSFYLENLRISIIKINNREL